MQRISYQPEQFKIFIQLIRWSILVLPVSVGIGTLVALFLWLLDLATETRWQMPWLLFLLPIAGVLIQQVYLRYGKNSEAGNNLILDEIHRPDAGIPARMAPLVLATTVVTHLFGGSAGREGTAVQIGGSVSALFAKWYKLRTSERRTLLLCGIAAGFGAVFGTPVAGAVFALEVLAIGKVRYNALLPCLIAGFVADATCSAWGITHTAYHVSYTNVHDALLPVLHVDVLLVGKVVVAGVLFGLTGFIFAQATHVLKKKASEYIPYNWLIPVAGGCSIIALTYAIGTSDYLGLGVTSANDHGVSITSAFKEGGSTYFSWAWKLIFTVITISTGFKGGEVTPLFFIGATLGNAIATLSGAPVDLMAALGFVAVFAAATNTPLACIIMGVELFGGEHILYFAIACITAYYFSGHSGIYRTQRVEVNKLEEADS